MLIGDSLGRKPTLAEIHAMRPASLWHVSIPENIRQELEKVLGKVITEKDLIQIIDGLASGRYAIVDKFPPHYHK